MIRVTHTGRLPVRVWDAQAQADLALVARAALIDRVGRLGRDDKDQPFAGYSEAPVKVYYRTEAARRLKPKGGDEFDWVKGPRMPGGGYDASKIGQPGGRFYADGYRGFKRESRLGSVGTEVDLTLSGNMLRSIQVIRHNETVAVIGFTGDAREYGPHVDARRPFMALSPANEAEMVGEMPRLIAGAAARATNA